jgi:GtrA-like protein
MISRASRNNCQYLWMSFLHVGLARSACAGCHDRRLVRSRHAVSVARVVMSVSGRVRAARARRRIRLACRPSFRRLAKFNITSLADLSVNVMIVCFLARRGVYFLAANFVGIAVAVIVNYTFSVAWVWRREK